MTIRAQRLLAQLAAGCVALVIPTSAGASLAPPSDDARRGAPGWLERTGRLRSDDFALFGPGFAPKVTSAAGRAYAKAVIASARAALSRPPGVNPSRSAEPPAGSAPSPSLLAPPVVDPQAADRARGSLGDAHTVLDLALAWRLNKERAFLDQANRYFLVLANSYEVAAEPIQEHDLSDFVLAYDLTERDLPRTTRDAMDAYFRRMATAYLGTMETGKVRIPQTLTNNWQSNRLQLAGLAAFQTGDPALIARTKALFLKQIGANLHPDGSTLDFDQRDALHYVNYSLQALLTVALAAKLHGDDWYRLRSPDGSSLAKSVEWLSHFATGEHTHTEFVKSAVPLDRQRAEAGHPTYKPHLWKPFTAARLFSLAAQLDPKYGSLRDNLVAEAARQTEPEPDEVWQKVSWMVLFPGS